MDESIDELASELNLTKQTIYAYENNTINIPQAAFLLFSERVKNNNLEVK